ncbi:MAG: DUF721 domain-containing protein [Gammaproteobacteria bacterium]|nr:MAG: DUF721 domain-containing protein [Gammaproteobacteria bacterium]
MLFEVPAVRQKKLSSLNRLITDGDGRLADLAREAARRSAQTRGLVQVLPTGLREHVRHLSVAADGTAVVTVDSAAWASRLRYDPGAVLDALAAAGISAQALQVKVRPQHS